jgi:hypothetical protein
VLAYLLLALAQTLGVLAIPFGAPGLWLQVAALWLFGWWTEFGVVGPVPLIILLFVALAAELAELPLVGGRLPRAARRRPGLAAVGGAVVGAVIGEFVPLVGSLFGALAGAFVGAFLGVLGGGRPRQAGANVVGLVLAISLKTAASVVIAVFTLITLVR